MDYAVKVVRKGDQYGLDDCLVHDEDEPFVEIYDADYAHDSRFTPGLGQFVSRYYASTFMKHNPNVGLDLQGDIPKWKLTAQQVNQIIERLPEDVKAWKFKGISHEVLQASRLDKMREESGLASPPRTMRPKW